MKKLESLWMDGLMQIQTCGCREAGVRVNVAEYLHAVLYSKNGIIGAYGGSACVVVSVGQSTVKKTGVISFRMPCACCTLADWSAYNRSSSFFAGQVTRAYDSVRLVRR